MDFPLILALLIIGSLVVCICDRLWWAPRRHARGIVAPPPTIVEYARSLLPIFLIVFALRSFIAEPFRIPSNSMMPTLLTGDFIIVNKFSYGIRLPIINRKIIDIGSPQRGDVIVFRYPKDHQTPFIKRVVGLPGDRIGYYDKVLYVNGQAMRQKPLGHYIGFGSGKSMSSASWRNEQLDQRPHEILVQSNRGSLSGEQHVPPGHYFVLGDNRDNSHDSRYWGTVPDELLIGKAFGIWMHWDWGYGNLWDRFGTAIN